METKLSIIGCTGIPARYGGFETFAENICRILKNSMEITVFCDKSFYNKNERTKRWKGITRKFLPLPANGPFSVFYDLISILISLRKSDIILLLGTGSGIFMPFFSRIKKAKFIIHLDGIEWIRPKWNLPVRKYLYYSFKQSIKFSDYLILDNSALKYFIPEKYHNKLVDVKYGADHLHDIETDEGLHTKPFALMICRAEPENNLQLIINAFENIIHLDLIIISNWSQTRLGRKLKRTCHHSRNIFFKDPLYDRPELLQKYRKQCKIYIHGHGAGGTNPSLVEAMYSGCPILAFDSVSNRNTTQNHAFYFQDSMELVHRINKLSPDQWMSSVKQMKEYAMNFYTWEKVIQQLRTII
ncbi:MAG: DUF1972 domain-containing protein [Bacteroidales bacterium]|nr:DUF1972 domain-containing protein [Bacteroidales bacterium]